MKSTLISTIFGATAILVQGAGGAAIPIDASTTILINREPDSHNILFARIPELHPSSPKRAIPAYKEAQKKNDPAIKHGGPPTIERSIPAGIPNPGGAPSVTPGGSDKHKKHKKKKPPHMSRNLERDRADSTVKLTIKGEGCDEEDGATYCGRGGMIREGWEGHEHEVVTGE